MAIIRGTGRGASFQFGDLPQIAQKQMDLTQ